MMKIDMPQHVVDGCIRELKNLSFKEVNLEDLEDIQVYEPARAWHFRDREVDYTVVLKTERNVWDLYAYAVNDYYDNYDYVLVAKPEGPIFRKFFNDFRMGLRKKRHSPKGLTHVRS